ncbi:hypothetical protein RND81_06G118600 [Saponaria officinalis]|uniref:DUF7032 domain-containing protein n=1 Tax=Saponaria officinalis TaxID=3572 RepID=A0AAW1K8W7_SAPOF
MVEEQKPTREYVGNISQIINNITSLILLSYTIRVFSIKWQLIRKRLEELNSGLIALENTQYSSLYDQVIADVVALVYWTVDECHNLASLCISVSYAGKLQMQSDLDKVISKLDLVLGKFDVIYHTDGLITGGLDLVVSRPPVGATREDMKFYVKDLLNRLKIGDFQMKKQALISLNEAITKDEKYVKIIIDLGDFILVIVSCLDSSDYNIQEEATIAIKLISGFDFCRGSLVVSGVIAQLVRTLENNTTSIKAKENTIRSLMTLTENGENAWAFSAHGGVTALLKICTENDSTNELIEPACCVLRNVVVVDEIKRFIIEYGAISTFIELINSRDELGQIGSIELLQFLAEDDECVRNLVVNEGGVWALVRVFDPKLDSSFKLRETVLRAIETLCFNSIDCVHLLINYGFLDQLLYFLRKGDVSMQELAIKSTYRLCTISEEARKVMGDAGFMSEFVKFIDTKPYRIREMAAKSLSNVVTVPKNSKKFSNDDHNIGVILQLLDPKEQNSEIINLLLSIILSISRFSHAKRIILHCGYVKNIEKLAEIGFFDAKKIIRKISTNRFKSMLNGIWHP